MRRVLALVPVVGLALAACSAGDAGGGASGCRPGTEAACLCDGRAGVRTCGPDRRFGPCVCEEVEGPEFEAVPADPTGRADGFLDFGQVAVGETAVRGIALRNPGAGPLALTIGAPAAPFAVEAAASIAPGATLQLPVVFAPTEDGPNEGWLWISAAGATLTVRLAGDGLATVVHCGDVDLGRVYRGTALVHEVGCFNDGRAPVELVEARLTGPSAADLRVEGPLGTAGPEERWALFLTFAPSAVGPAQAAVALVDASGREVAGFEFRAEAVDRALAIDPPTLDFGPVPLGYPARQALRLRNLGAAPLRIVEVRLADTASPALSIASPALPLELPGHGEAEVAVDFVATEPGIQYGALVVEADRPFPIRELVALRGVGGGPLLACTPEAIDLGEVAIALPASATVTCTNVGTEGSRLEIGEIRATASEFSVTPREPVPAALAVGETLAIDVTYRPADDGADTAAVEVVANAINARLDAPYRIEVAGTGRDLPPCLLQATPDPLAFGIVAPGAAAVLEVVLENRRADAACLVRDLRLAPECAFAFDLPEGELAAATIPAGGALHVPVRFAPSTAGASSCDLRFAAADPAAPHRTVALEGTAKEPCVIFDPPEVDFGVVAPGCASRTRQVSVQNRCPAPLKVLDIDPAAGDGFFVLGEPMAGTVVPEGARVSFKVGFQPATPGGRLGGFFIVAEGEAAPYLLPARGESRSPPLATERFTIRGPDSVDVLFVIDNGASMGPVQAALAGNFGSFVAPLDAAGIGWQLGVTTTGLTTPASPTCPGGAGGGEDGRLFPIDGSRPRILTPSTPNVAARWAANVTVGTCHDTPTPLEAAYRALSPPVVDHADDPRHPAPGDGNLGLLRPDAHLAVVAITDEMDHSPETVNFYAFVLAAAKGPHRPDLFSFHAITGYPGTGCAGPGGAAAPGDRLIAVVERTDTGTFHSICSSNWSATLGGLGDGIVQALRPRCLPLGGQPEDSDADGEIDDELEVRVDGVVRPATGPQGQVLWTFEEDRHALCFPASALPEPGAAVAVSYRTACLPPP